MKTNSLKPFGVEIVDTDLSVPLALEEQKQLRDIFDANYLVVFRGQNMSNADHVRVVADLLPGEPPTTDDESRAEQYSFISNDDRSFLDDGRLTFHSDYSFTTEPDKIISLYGYEIEPNVSPTEFASGAAALVRLSDGMRTQLSELNIINAVRIDSFEAHLPNYALPGQDDLSGLSHEVVMRACWPAISAHPRTGEPMLFISEQHSHHFQGHPIDYSHKILGEVFDTLYADDNIYRHDWRTGDLVIWDNFAISHGRRATPRSTALRVLRRVKIGKVATVPLPRLWQYSQQGIV